MRKIVSHQDNCIVQILTVGTSIIRNLKTIYDKYCNKTKDDLCFQKILEEVRSDPYKNSAELNSMKVFLKEHEKKRETINYVELLTSDTEDGEFTAKIIQKTLKEKWGIDSSITRVKHLGKIFETGTSNLLEELSEKIKKHKDRGCEIRINLTGGYKPESAMAYLAAALLQVNTVYYMHETMHSVAELPVLPLEIKKEVLEDLKKVKNKHTCKEWLETGIPHKKIAEYADHGLIEENGPVCKVKEHVKTIIEYYNKKQK